MARQAAINGLPQQVGEGKLQTTSNQTHPAKGIETTERQYAQWERSFLCECRGAVCQQESDTVPGEISKNACEIGPAGRFGQVKR